MGKDSKGIFDIFKRKKSIKNDEHLEPGSQETKPNYILKDKARQLKRVFGSTKKQTATAEDIRVPTMAEMYDVMCQSLEQFAIDSRKHARDVEVALAKYQLPSDTHPATTEDVGVDNQRSKKMERLAVKRNVHVDGNRASGSDSDTDGEDEDVANDMGDFEPALYGDSSDEYSETDWENEAHAVDKWGGHTKDGVIEAHELLSPSMRDVPVSPYCQSYLNLSSYIPPLSVMCKALIKAKVSSHLKDVRNVGDDHLYHWDEIHLPSWLSHKSLGSHVPPAVTKQMVNIMLGRRNHNNNYPVIVDDEENSYAVLIEKYLSTATYDAQNDNAMVIEKNLSTDTENDNAVVIENNLSIATYNAENDNAVLIENNLSTATYDEENNNAVLTEKSSSTTTMPTEHVLYKTNKKSKSNNRKLVERIDMKKRKCNCHFLAPIGTTSTQGLPSKGFPKWMDVASLIEQGTYTHRNLRLSRETPLTTLPEEMVTPVLIKLRCYSVRPLKPQMTCLKALMTINETSRIFAETHAKFVCVNVLLALRFLHNHDLFHGSICPAKIVFNDKGYPCLTGFGTAEIIEDRQGRPRERLELGYTSPEQLYLDYISEVTDQFSLGALVYAMVYGKPPHQGTDSVETRRNLSNRKFVPLFAPEEMSTEGREFITKCIRKDDLKRFSLLHLKKSLFDSVSWFSRLNEEKLYKQLIPSPILHVMKNL